MVAHRLNGGSGRCDTLLFSDGQLKNGEPYATVKRRAACINGSGNTISRRNVGCQVEHRKRWWKMKTIITTDNTGTARHLAPAYLNVGSQARMLRRSMLALLLAAFMQGIALPVFIRSLMRCYGRRAAALNWAMAFSVAAIVTLVLRWYGFGL